MKQFALSLALLSAVSIISAEKLEVELTHNGKTINEVLDLEIAKELAIQNDEISAKVQFTQQENNELLVAATVIKRNADGTQEVVHDGLVVAFALDENGRIANVEESAICPATEGKSVLTVRSVK